MLALRPYQSDAVRRVLHAYEQGAQGVCLVAPTGAGKTRMAEEIAGRFRNALMLVPSLAIYSQSAGRFNTLTVQSMLEAERASPFGDPDLVIWDECHHSASDKWSRVRERWPGAKWLGLTATPVRSDGKPLAAFDTWVVAVEYSQLVADEVIVPCELYLPAKQSPKDKIDADPVTQFLLHVPHGVRSLAFCADIAQCEDVVRGVGPRAAAYHSGVSEATRRERLKAFALGTIDLLVTHDMLTEGFDLPQVVVILLARPCHELGTYLQIAGRGARACAGKKMFHLIDCSGASRKHGNPIQDWAFDRDVGIRPPPGSTSNTRAVRNAEPRILEARLQVTPVNPGIAADDLDTVHDRMLAAARGKAEELIANGANASTVRRALDIALERIGG